MSSGAAVSFRGVYEGWLSGLLQWADLDRVLASIAAAPEGWWIYDTRGEPPSAPETAASLPARLDEIVAFLKRHHRADYLGFVYVDDRSQPSMVKVYDPRNASSCSLGTPIPVYTVSRQRPERLPFEVTPAAEPARTGLLGRLFGGSQ
jgi:hypothetical protein